MSLNETPQGERLHIGIFGRRNAGKSSLLNSLTGQDIAVVSEVKGTTTDPVYKTMELLPIGPVVFIDTAGIDDDSELGELRIGKTRKVLRKTDIALLVVDAEEGLSEEDRRLIAIFEDLGVKHLVVYNKSDLMQDTPRGEFCVSCKTGKNIHELKEKIAEVGKEKENERRLIADLISANDVVVLVIPIDKAAPKGRLILPQQQAIRDILEAGAIAAVTREVEFGDTLKRLKAPPALVITDSQVFGRVSQETPADVPLTSFSILMARYKGILESAVHAAKTLDTIQDGDRILISEGCTHHRQCDDIGTVKLPKWIKQYTKKEPVFEFSSGTEFPNDLSGYKLIIHCGGCMLNSREMIYREHFARKAGIPMTNYGVAISFMQGILERCLVPCK
ncbi:MAG: [FeFe] hydrogenase H-cluster maturation GTPase HydF [Treponema sp.]|jgi:[FeFe] hydrogenase H-cluster maturation GTPase HydF|nr:[FeFe] hydrogenase H-cluster maturation GTPase HydF [Treponema sp.]